MLVFAFDRDWTVDVNPHPQHEAVPLAWVRQLAHETPHAIYAIGNQALADEAAIPGVVDIVGRHPDDWDRWLGGKGPDGRYERFPDRRDRLALIADLHPNADGYVVVDDLDLSDVDGWEHYHAWEFVPAVERGEVHPDLPWAREPVTDGGPPAAAGIVPTDPSTLASFLDNHRDAPAFEVRFTDDGTERTRLCHRVAIHAERIDRPPAAPAIRCTPVAPGDDTFTVGLDAIEMLSTADPSPDRYTADARTPAEEAAGLRRLADANPEAVPLPSLLSHLDCERDDPIREKDAVRALRHVAMVRPEDCTQAVPLLRSLLARDELPVREDVLATLRAIGTADPSAIAPLADEFVAFLDAGDGSVRREATRCLAAIAAEHPEDALDAVPGLATVIEDGADGREHAVYALTQLTQEDPDSVKPVAEVLGEVVLDDSLSDDVRLNATAGLGRIVGEQPSVGVDIVDDVAPLLDADSHKLRNNAIGLLGDVAIVHTDVIEPYAEEIAALLTVDDTYTRINASAALSRVAADFPDSVEHVTPTFVELLSDDHPLVRKNACWALGRLGATEATEVLAERAHGDSDADVRKRASWALAEING